MYDRSINEKSHYYKTVLKTRKWMWAAYSYQIPFFIWIATSSLAAMGFIYLWYSVMRSSQITTGYFVGNTCFIFFSMLYAPLVQHAYLNSKDGTDNMFWPEVAVVVDLLLVSASAWCMVWFLVPSGNVWEILASVMLAFHCTVMDSFIWAYVWVTDVDSKRDIYHNGIDERKEYEIQETDDPRKGANARISYSDVPVVKHKKIQDTTTRQP